MASVIDLEDEDLIDADENDLYNTIDHRDDDDDGGEYSRHRTLTLLPTVFFL